MKRKTVRRVRKVKSKTKEKLPRVLSAVKRQTGKSVKSADKSRTAMKPGKRKAKSGRTYWETRANRSDRNKRTRL